MIYIHIPFCKSFCTYCGFYSELCTGGRAAGQQELFVSSVLDEISRRRDAIKASRASGPDTLYIGGGTPSVLDIKYLKNIVEALPGDGAWEEFTIEVNPDDIVSKGEAYVRELMALGADRISMGVQSFDDGILRWMRRRHDGATAHEAFSVLRAAGVRNVSMDLIFGIAGLSNEMWRRTIDQALALHPEHISAYQLSTDEDSELYEMTADGRYTPLPEDECRAQYDILCARLGEAGYNHYEVSNWALPGREARHNSAYWLRVPYVGLGPGAHSFDGARRSWNGCGVQGYDTGHESLSAEDVRVETIMLALRTAKGISEVWLRDNADNAAIDALLSDGSLVRVDAGSPRFRVPEERFFVSDSIISRLV